MMFGLNIYSSSHTTARFVLGSGLLFLSIMTQSMLFCFALTLCYIFMMRLLDGGWLMVTRLLKLMQWFVFPILLLHALLSPGQLLMPDMWISISREGLMKGVELSLHLSAVFFAAMLMFKLLQRAEWLGMIVLMPWLGSRLLVYVWLMTSMRMNVSTMLGALRGQFRLRKDLKNFPLLLMSAFQLALSVASEHAAALWLRWPEQADIYHPMRRSIDCSVWRYRMASGLVASVGVMAFVVPLL